MYSLRSTSCWNLTVAFLSLTTLKLSASLPAPEPYDTTKILSPSFATSNAAANDTGVDADNTGVSSYDTEVGDDNTGIDADRGFAADK